jgi:hypothetical protein
MTQDHEESSQNPARHDASSPSTTANVGQPLPPSGDRVHTQSTPSRQASAHAIKGLVPTAIVALVFGMIGAYADLHYLEKPKAPSDTTGADSSAGPEQADSPTRLLSDQVAKISDRVDALNRRIDDLPRPTPPPDLSDLQVRVAELTEAAEGFRPIREAIRRVEGRMDDLGRKVGSLGDAIHAAPAPTEGGTGRHEDLRPTPEKPVSEEALAQAAELFQKRNYKDALAIFSKLEQTNPEDARVWYYAALAHGFSTKQWTEDGTGALVEKGIAREQAGTPPSAVIDETFKHLTSDTGKDWLAAYRKRVKAH